MDIKEVNKLLELGFSAKFIENLANSTEEKPKEEKPKEEKPKEEKPKEEKPKEDPKEKVYNLTEKELVELFNQVQVKKEQNKKLEQMNNLHNNSVETLDEDEFDKLQKSLLGIGEK